MTPSVSFGFACLADLAFCCGGYLAPASRRFLEFADLFVTVIAFGLSLALTHESWPALCIAMVLVTSYGAAQQVRNAAPISSIAFQVTFYGAGSTLLVTSHRMDCTFIATIGALFATPVAYKLTHKTHRAVGLAIIGATLTFQLSRVPRLLEPGVLARASAGGSVDWGLLRGSKWLSNSSKEVEAERAAAQVRADQSAACKRSGALAFTQVNGEVACLKP